jgi:hypothetical protein
VSEFSRVIDSFASFPRHLTHSSKHSIERTLSYDLLGYQETSLVIWGWEWVALVACRRGFCCVPRFHRTCMLFVLHNG